MTPREQELALRRAALLERSTRLRTDIAQTTEEISSRLSGVGRIASAVQMVTRAPVLLAGTI
jgi:hypothetical protein